MLFHTVALRSTLLMAWIHPYRQVAAQPACPRPLPGQLLYLRHPPVVPLDVLGGVRDGRWVGVPVAHPVPAERRGRAGGTQGWPQGN